MTLFGLTCRSLEIKSMCIWKLIVLRRLAMITDVQLAIFANVLGVALFLMVVLFHYVAANNPKNKPE